MVSYLKRTASRVAVGGVLLGAALTGAAAEGGPFSSPTRFFYDQQILLQRHGATPPRPRAVAPDSRRSAGPTSARAVVAQPRAQKPMAAPAPRKAPSVAVAVFGDRLAQALARGLEDDAGERFAVSVQTAEDAGLVRADFDDWVRGLAGRLEASRPAVALLMVGSNDREALPDGSGMAAPFTPRWQSLYTSRIDTVTKLFRSAGVPLIWVGLPSVRNGEASTDFVRLNGLYRDRAAADGAAFVDSWEAFSDDSGGFSPVGPDIEGRIVVLRKADGVGFTRAGARKLASFVEGDIKRLQGRPAAAPPVPVAADITIEKAREFDSALDIDINAQIQREAALMPNVGPVATGATPALSAVDAASQKPAAGPVISLTAAPAAPGGELATSSIPPAGAGLQATLAVKQTETTGPDAPRPGRADDFSWPKP